MNTELCCGTAIQETRIPSEMCAGETCITDGKHASLVIYVRGHMHRDICAGNTIPGETRIPMTPAPVTEILLLFYRHANLIGYNANDVLSIT